MIAMFVSACCMKESELAFLQLVTSAILSVIPGSPNDIHFSEGTGWGQGASYYIQCNGSLLVRALEEVSGIENIKVSTSSKRF